MTGFSLVFVCIVVISSVSYHNTSVMIANSRLDTRSHELVQLLNNIDVAMDEAEHSHRRYLVTGDPQYLRAYRMLVQQKPTFIEYLNDLTQGSPEQQQRVGLLNQMMDQQLNAEASAIAQRDGGGFEAVREMALEGASKRELSTIHRIIAEMESYERQALRSVSWSLQPVRRAQACSSALAPCSNSYCWHPCTT